MMKKLVISLTALLVLAGCKDASVEPSYDETLFTVEDQTVTQKDLFDVMKQYDAGVMQSSVLINKAQETLIEDVEIDKDIKKRAENQVDEIKTMLGDEYLDILANIGYDTEEEYIEDMLYPELKFEKLIKEEVDEDFDKLVEEYRPRQIRVLEVDEDKAKSALQQVKDGEKFDEVAESYAKTESMFKGQKEVHLLASARLPEIVTDFLNKNDSPTLSDILNEEESETSFIVQIIEVDANKFEEEAKTSFLQSDEVTQNYVGKVFRSKNFKVYDRDLYDSILETNPSYLEEPTEVEVTD